VYHYETFIDACLRSAWIVEMQYIPDKGGQVLPRDVEPMEGGGRREGRE
jgi:hypothetical protein